MASPRPKIGLALRGASNRAVFYIGFFEVLEEQGIPIDYIAAISSSTVVAAAYACGTLPQLKKRALTFDKDFFSTLIEKSKSKRALYSLDKGEEVVRMYTRNLRFEEVKPLMGFVTVDLNRGEQVVLGMGDIARAIRASCTLPWVFEPVAWGNRSLVDGGIMNLVPGDVAQNAGMDIVIGIDLRTSDYIFSHLHVQISKALRLMKRLLLINQAEKLWDRFGEWFEANEFFRSYKELGELEQAEYPGMWEVLGRAMDLAIATEKKYKNEQTFNCDLLIKPRIPPKSGWKKYLYLDMMDFSSNKDLYLLGRDTALEYTPKIWQMMADFQDQQEKATESLKVILN